MFLRYPQATAWFADRGLNIAEATLRRWVSRQAVPFIKAPGGKIVLFDPQRLEQFIAERAVEPRSGR